MDICLHQTHMFCAFHGPSISSYIREREKESCTFSSEDICVSRGIMEKSRSFPEYSSTYSGSGFGFEDRSNSNSYSFNGPRIKGNGFAASNDPELKRKKRVASYNVFTVERKLKSSVRNSFKWIKGKFSDVRYGV